MVQKILVAVDGSEHSEKAVDFTIDLAKRHQATVYLVHVVSKPSVPEDFSRYVEAEKFQDPPETVYLQKIGEQMLGRVESRIRKSGIEDVHLSLLVGDPAQEILDFSRDQGVDMIVIGSRGLGNVKGLLLGSVSSKVCHLAESTCVTVK